MKLYNTIYIYIVFSLLVSNSFLLLLVRHLFLVAMHLFLVAFYNYSVHEAFGTWNQRFFFFFFAFDGTPVTHGGLQVSSGQLAVFARCVMRSPALLRCLER